MLEYEVLRGGEFVDMLVQLIDGAKRRVYLATYIASLNPVTEDVYYALARKRRAGVDVRVLLDGASSEADRYNAATEEFLSSLGVPVVRSKRFMHVKLYIVDSYSIVGSHNLTSISRDSYEVSVLLRSKRASSELGRFFLEVYEGGNPEPAVYGDSLEDGTRYEIMTGYRILGEVFERTALCSRRAKAIMYIATTSSATKRYFRLLREKERSGVDVTVVLDGTFKLSRRYNEEAVRYMRSIGLSKVALTSKHTHAKVLVLDDSTVIGSHNLTSASIAGRLELAVCIGSSSLSNAMDYTIEDIYSSEVGRS